MNASGRDGQLAERLFRAATAAYTASTRERFADEMLQVFIQGYASASKGGSSCRRLRYLVREFIGLATTAARDRWIATREWSVARGQLLSFATCVFVFVLCGYVWTLAPTVTFWDAGEFLAASKTLGVPHPPGSPVFVFLSNVWARVIPFGNYAFRVNLLTAVFGAAAATMFAAVVFTVLNDKGRKVWPGLIGGSSAALLSAFTFTVWQNSNESEVYMTAAFVVAATCFLAMQWRKARGTRRDSQILLVILYLAALSVGNHLMALLAGPALSAFMIQTLITDPAADPRDRRREWATLGLISAAWAALIGLGLGNGTLSLITGVLFIIATAYASRVGAWRMTLATVFVVGAGISTFLFLYVRAGFDPFLNEADPSTWNALVAVVQRAQYPPRLPTDNPLFLSGPNNPGRTMGLLWLQILNYVQYFDWQWSRGVAFAQQLLPLERLPFTIGYLWLGLAGFRALWRTDRGIFLLLTLVFFATGPGLVLYMNFKPGFSIGYASYPDFSMHEVRERDYFFVISFQVWGVLAAMGLFTFYSILRAWLRRSFKHFAVHRLALISLGLATVPFALNFPAASRAHGPDATLARDFARNLLNTVEPYGVLFTNGDNDTFPLWYQQAVEAFRPDVTVVVMPLSGTEWFIRQLRDRETPSFLAEQAPWFSPSPNPPSSPLLSWTDQEIAALQPWVVLPEDFHFRVGSIETTYPAGTALLRQDILALRLIRENAGKRPIYLSTTAGSGGASWERLSDSLVQEGLALKLYVEQKPAALKLPVGAFNLPVDVERTTALVNDAYSYSDLFSEDSLRLDSTSQRIAGNLAAPFLSLAQAHLTRGNADAGIENLERAYHLAPDRQLGALLESMRQ